MRLKVSRFKQLLSLINTAAEDDSCIDWPYCIKVRDDNDSTGTQIEFQRLAYREMIGTIPVGFHVKWSCKNKRCCRPSHLIATNPVRVTAQEAKDRDNASRRLRNKLYPYKKAAMDRRYKRSHREQCRERERQRIARNPDKERQVRSAWRKANPLTEDQKSRRAEVRQLKDAKKLAEKIAKRALAPKPEKPPKPVKIPRGQTPARKAYMAKYLEANKEHINQIKKEYRSRDNVRAHHKSNDSSLHQRNRYERLKGMREYRRTHHEKLREQQRDWYKRNQDKLVAQRQENKAQRSARFRAWRLANHENQTARAAKRRALKLAANGSHTASDIKALWKRQKHKCAVPGCALPISGSGKHRFHVDHHQPLAKKGGNGADNLVILCATHNHQKHAKDPYEWAQTLALAQGLLFIK